MQCNGIFSSIIKYMECIHFERLRCGVSKHVYDLTYRVIDERNIHRITSDLEKIHLVSKPPPRQCTLSFLENRYTSKFDHLI